MQRPEVCKHAHLHTVNVTVMDWQCDLLHQEGVADSHGKGPVQYQQVLC